MNYQDIVRQATALLFRVFFRNRPAILPVPHTGVRKILILRYDVMGDMTVTTPMISFLKRNLPNSELHIVGSARNAGILRCNTDLTKIYVYDFSFASFFRIARQCRKEKYDVVLATVFHKTTKSGAWANFCGGRQAVKVTNMHVKRAKLYSAMFNAMAPLVPGVYSMAEVLIQLAAATFGLNYTSADISFSIPYNTRHADKAEQYVKDIPYKNRIFINISTGKPETKWSCAQWINLIGMLNADFPKLRFFIAGSSADGADILQIANKFPDTCFAFPPSTDILDVCALIDRCRLAITPDTAIVHIATGLKKPVLGLYTPLHTGTEYLPLYKPYRVVFSPKNQPVSQLTPDIVSRAFNELLFELDKLNKSSE